MKVEWRKAGDPAYVTLGDDAARHTVLIEQWDAVAQVQQEALFRAAHPFVEPRGNVAGTLAFRATRSHASLDAAALALIEAQARVNQRGDLRLTLQSTVLNYPGAVLAAVARGGKEGVRLEIIYSFILLSVTTGP